MNKRIRLNFNVTNEEKKQFQKLANKNNVTNVDYIFEMFSNYKAKKGYDDNFFRKKHIRKTKRFYILPTESKENAALYEQMKIIAEIERVSISDLLYIFLKNQ